MYSNVKGAMARRQELLLTGGRPWFDFQPAYKTTGGTGSPVSELPRFFGQILSAALGT